jgi:Flp pilus assembly protein TadB
MVLASIGLVVRSPSLLIAGPLVWLGCLSLYRTSRGRKQVQENERELLAIVDQIAHELRSGNSLATAFTLGCQHPSVGEEEKRSSSETASTLRIIADAVTAGERLEVALERMLQADQGKQTTPALRLLAIAVVVLVEAGGPAGPAIERLSETLRARQAGLDETRTQASQATASAVVLAGLPLMFALLLAGADHRIARFYFSSMLGAVCVVGSLVLVAAGWTWIQKLVWQ